MNETIQISFLSLSVRDEEFRLVDDAREREKHEQVAETEREKNK